MDSARSITESNSLAKDNEDEYKEQENDDESNHQQAELYKSTLQRINSPPVAAQRSRSPSLSKQQSRSNSPKTTPNHLTSSTTNFNKTSNLKRATSAKSFNSVSFLSSVNDLKYMGDQFKVGKFNPGLMSSHEKLFQSVYRKRLRSLRESNQNKKTIRPLSATANLTSPTLNLYTVNDFKYKGEQFKVGIVRPPIGLGTGDYKPNNSNSPNGLTFEEKFQILFKDRLDKLKPNTNLNRNLSFRELKEWQEAVSVKPVESKSFRKNEF